MSKLTIEERFGESLIDTRKTAPRYVEQQYAELSDKERGKLFFRRQQEGLEAPTNDGFFGELGEGVMLGGTEFLHGVGKTATELGLGEGLEKSIEEYRSHHQDREPYSEYAPSQSFTNLGALGRSIGHGVGNSIPSIALTAAGTVISGPVGFGLGVTATAASIYGERKREMDELIPDNKGMATLAAVLTTGVESCIEQGLGPQRMVGELTSSIAKQTASSFVKREVLATLTEIAKKHGVSALTRAGLSFVEGGIEEGMEEVLQDASKTICAKICGSDTAEFSSFKENLESFLGGAIPGAFMGGGGRVLADARVHGNSDGILMKDANGRPLMEGGREVRLMPAELARRARDMGIVTDDEIRGTGFNVPEARAAQTQSEQVSKISQKTGVDTEAEELRQAKRADDIKQAKSVAKLLDTVFGTKTEIGEAADEFLNQRGEEARATLPEEQQADFNPQTDIRGARNGKNLYIRGDGNDTIRTIGHEFKHYIDEFFPETATQIDKELHEILNDGGRAVLENTIAERGEKNGRQEFSADMFGAVLDSEKWMEHFVKRLETKSPGLGKKFLQAVEKFVSKILDYIKGHPENAEAYHGLVNHFETLEKTVGYALADIAEKKGAKKTAKNSAARQLDLTIVAQEQSKAAQDNVVPAHVTATEEQANPAQEEAVSIAKSQTETGKTVNSPSADESRPSEWGRGYPEFASKGINAIKKLLSEKQGYVPAAFHRDDLGDIDIVWGKTGEGEADKGGYGLAHILKRHGEINWDSFDKVLRNGEYHKTNQGKVTLEDKNDNIVIGLSFHNSPSPYWVITAYGKKINGHPQLSRWPSQANGERALDSAPGVQKRGKDKDSSTSMEETKVNKVSPDVSDNVSNAVENANDVDVEDSERRKDSTREVSSSEKEVGREEKSNERKDPNFDGMPESKFWELVRGMRIAQGSENPAQLSEAADKCLANIGDTNFGHRFIPVLRRIALNSFTPAETLSKLAEANDFETRVYVGYNKNTPPKTLAKLADDADYNVRIMVAGNESTPVEVLAKLSKGEDVRVAESAKKNPKYAGESATLEKTTEKEEPPHERELSPADVRSLPLEERKRIAGDDTARKGSPQGSGRAVSTLEGRGTATAGAEQQKSAAVKPETIGNSSEQPKTDYKKILRSSDSDTLVSAAKRVDCPADILEKLSHSPITAVRTAVARNPSSDEKVLRRLASDGSPFVRGPAKSSLKRIGIDLEAEAEAKANETLVTKTPEKSKSSEESKQLEAKSATPKESLIDLSRLPKLKNAKAESSRKQSIATANLKHAREFVVKSIHQAEHADTFASMEWCGNVLAKIDEQDKLAREVLQRVAEKTSEKEWIDIDGGSLENFIEDELNDIVEEKLAWAEENEPSELDSDNDTDSEEEYVPTEEDKKEFEELAKERGFVKKAPPEINESKDEQKSEDVETAPKPEVFEKTEPEKATEEPATESGQANTSGDLFGFGRVQDRQKNGGKTILERLHERMESQRLPVSEVFNDDTRIPNFKRGANPKTGEVNPLQGKVMGMENPIVVMEFNDGKKVVVTGRHRLALYKRNNEETIPAYVIREADGWTVDDAKTLDAYSNIKDDQGTISDYFDFFSETGMTRAEAEEEGLLRHTKAVSAFGIANGASTELKESIDWNGTGGKNKISPTQAGIIASALPVNENPRFAAAQIRIISSLAREAMTNENLTGFAYEQKRRALSMPEPSSNGGMHEVGLFENETEFLAQEEYDRKISEARNKVGNRYAAIANIIRQALSKKKAVGLELKPEFAKQLGITDRSNMAQLQAAWDKSDAFARYWKDSRFALKPEDQQYLDRILRGTKDGQRELDFSIRKQTRLTRELDEERKNILNLYVAEDGGYKRGWLRAPDGSLSALSSMQWTVAKTDSFKKENGDWENAAVYQLVRSMPAVEIRKMEAVADVKTTYRSIGSETNRFDGRITKFVNSSLGKILGHRGFDVSRIVPQLGEIFRDSIPIAFNAPAKNLVRIDGSIHKEHNNFVGYHDYLGKFQIQEDGTNNKYYIRYTVQETKTRDTGVIPNQLHSTYVSDVEIINAGVSPVISQISYRATDENTGIDNKLVSILRKAREDYKNLRIPLSENGEPFAADIDRFIQSRSTDYSDGSTQYSIRKEAPPKKTGIGYKVFVLKDGKLYPPMVANPGGEATPVGVWLDADAAPVAGTSKTGRPQVRQGGKGTQGGSGFLAYRPGWHLGEIPYATQFNRRDADGNRTLFPRNFVWAEVEYAKDKNYQAEADAEGMTESGKFRHSYAGMKRVPSDGYYMYRTNPDPNTDPWIITGAMKVNRILTREQADGIVRMAGRVPQMREGDNADYSISKTGRHRQVNQIRKPGEVHDEMKERIKQGYTVNHDDDVLYKAECLIDSMDGPSNFAEKVRDGVIKPNTDVQVRACIIVMNSPWFASLPKAERVKFEDMFVGGGTETARALRARRLDVTKYADLQAAVSLLLDTAPEGRKGELTIAEKLERRFNFDPRNIPMEVFNNIEKRDEFLRTLSSLQSSWKDKAYEWWVNSILSAPTTHAANAIGNASNFFYEFGAKRLAEATVNLFAKRDKGATFGEMREMWKQFNWKKAWDTFKTNFDLEVVEGSEGKFNENFRGPAIEGKKGRIIRIPGRLLRAADALAKQLVNPMEASAMAYRIGTMNGLKGAELSQYIEEQLSNPNSESSRYAEKRMLDLTFQEEPGAALNALASLRDRIPFARYVFPFLRTPYNLLRQGIRKGPLGVLNLAKETVDVARGKREFDNEMVSHIAEQLVFWTGAMALMATHSGDDEPWLTGNGLRYGTAEANWKKVHLPPQSIRMPWGQWVSYSRIEPLATGLAAFADGMNAYQNAEDGEKMTSALKGMLRGTGKVMLDKSYLQTFQQITEMLSDPEYRLPDWASTYAASWVPNIYRQTVNAMNDSVPDYRNRQTGKAWLGTYFKNTLSRAGLFRKTPKYDYFGRPLPKDVEEATGLDVMLRLGVPLQRRSIDTDPLDRMLWDWNTTHPQEAYYPSLATPKASLDGKEYKFIDHYPEFAEQSGKLAYKMLSQMARRGELNTRRPTKKDIELVKAVLQRARKQTRAEFIRKKFYDR